MKTLSCHRIGGCENQHSLRPERPCRMVMRILLNVIETWFIMCPANTSRSHKVNLMLRLYFCIIVGFGGQSLFIRIFFVLGKSLLHIVRNLNFRFIKRLFGCSKQIYCLFIFNNVTDQTILNNFSECVTWRR